MYLQVTKLNAMNFFGRQTRKLCYQFSRLGVRAGYPAFKPRISQRCYRCRDNLRSCVFLLLFFLFFLKMRHAKLLCFKTLKVKTRKSPS